MGTTGSLRKSRRRRRPMPLRQSRRLPRDEAREEVLAAKPRRQRLALLSPP
jgi:hypothetical protein